MIVFESSHQQQEWNQKRVQKIINIFTPQWFKDKRIIDLGCGHGNNGLSLIDLGALITFTDGRISHIQHLIDNGLHAFQMDNDKEWTINENFDMVIHWGLLYHLEYWRNDLRNVFKHTNLLCLESEVSDVENLEDVHEETGYDQALNERGTNLSTDTIEKFLNELGTTYTRYDDKDLDCGSANYSWTPGQDTGNKRRFWIVRKNNELSS